MYKKRIELVSYKMKQFNIYYVYSKYPGSWPLSGTVAQMDDLDRSLT